MKILIRNSDSVVLFAADDLVLTGTGLTFGGTPGSHVGFCTTANSVLAEVDSLPALWVGGEFAFIAGVWAPVSEERQTARIAADLATKKMPLIAAIEAAVLAVYSRPVTLAREYELREADAAAYQLAGYSGPVGRVLDGFATATGMTATAAANLVLTQSAAFRTAELNLADLRMRKYELSRATTVEQAETIHAETMASIKVIAAAIA